MRKSLVIVPASAAVMFCACSRPPDVNIAPPEVKGSTKYYRIHAGSLEQLKWQLDLRGGRDPSGRKINAATSWYVEWNYPYQKGAGGCATGPVKTTVTVVTQLPKWNPPPNVGPDLIAKWERYLAKLEEHEKGHRDIALKAARAVAQSLQSLAPQSSCEEMERVADAEGKRILNMARDTERTYDETTDHGAKQGARLE